MSCFAAEDECFRIEHQPHAAGHENDASSDLGHDPYRRSVSADGRLQMIGERCPGIAAGAEGQVAHDRVAHEGRTDRDGRLRQVHDFAGDAGEAAVQRAVDHDAGPEPVVEEQQREAGEDRSFSSGELGEGCEIHIVLDAHRTVEGGRQRRTERAAVGAEVVADAAVGGDDAGHSDDRQVNGALRRFHRAATPLDEGDDVGHAIFGLGERGVLLRPHGSAGVDEHDVGGMVIDVHGDGESEARMQGDPSGGGASRVPVEACRRDGPGVLEHPQHLRDRGA